MPVYDTSPSTLSVQLRAQKALTGEERIILAFEMSMFARELAAAGIRDDHPAWSESEISPRTYQARVFSPGRPARFAMNGLKPLPALHFLPSSH
jgi:hypothetical protein